MTISAYAHSLHPDVFYFYSDDYYDESDSDYDFFEESNDTSEPILPVFIRSPGASKDHSAVGDEGEGEEKQGLIYLNERKKSGRASTRRRGR